MKTIFVHALKSFGDESAILDFHPIPGGDINEAYFLQSEKRRYFIKFRKNPPPAFFKLEKLGLETINNTQTIAVPNVYVCEENNQYGFY